MLLLLKSLLVHRIFSVTSEYAAMPAGLEDRNETGLCKSIMIPIWDNIPSTKGTGTIYPAVRLIGRPPAAVVHGSLCVSGPGPHAQEASQDMDTQLTMQCTLARIGEFECIILLHCCCLIGKRQEDSFVYDIAASVAITSDTPGSKC